MTSVETLWRRRAWLFLWMHSASLWAPVVIFFALQGTGSTLRLFACLAPLIFFFLASPVALFVAHRKKLSPSKYIALFPLICVALALLISISFFVVPALAGVGVLLCVILTMWVLGGAVLALGYTIPALLHTTRELRKSEILMLGCARHRSQTTIALESAVDETLILKTRER